MIAARAPRALAPPRRATAPATDRPTIGAEVPTATRWSALSLALLAAATSQPTDRVVAAGALAVTYAAFRTAFPIRPDASPRRLTAGCGAEMLIALATLAVAGDWRSPLLLLVGAAALTSGLLGGPASVAIGTALTAVATLVALMVTGRLGGGLGVTLATVVVGATGAYGRHLHDAAISRVASASEMRSAIVERERIARELHDRVGQSVAMVALALDRVSAAWKASGTSGEEVPRELGHLAEDVRHASREVRAQLAELALPRRGAEVGASLAAHLARVGARGHVRPSLALDDDGSMPDAVAEDLFQVAKEAIANVERHAGATEVDVRLTVAAGCVRMIVADDGRGFASGVDEGVGLTSIRQRAARAGAEVEICSTPLGVSLVVELGGLG